MNLFDIAASVRAAILAEDVDPETGEIAQVALDRMATLDMDFDRKIEAIAAFAKESEAEAIGAKAIEAQLNRKRVARENLVKRLKTLLYEGLKYAHKERAGGNTFTACIERNGGKESLDIPDDAAVPRQFFYVPEPVEERDDEAIRAHLETVEGKKEPWGRLYRGDHLKIR